jgi:hypothetical protein
VCVEGKGLHLEITGIQTLIYVKIDSINLINHLSSAEEVSYYISFKEGDESVLCKNITLTNFMHDFIRLLSRII